MHERAGESLPTQNQQCAEHSASADGFVSERRTLNPLR